MESLSSLVIGKLFFSDGLYAVTLFQLMTPSPDFLYVPVCNNGNDRVGIDLSRFVDTGSYPVSSTKERAQHGAASRALEHCL